MTEQQKTVIFDLDGTLALVEHRRHLVRCEKPDWPAFFRACVDDEPNLPVIAAMKAHLQAGHRVEVWSGRSDEVFDETDHWFLMNLPTECLGFPIRMRPEGDYTPDEELKASWLAEIGPENVLCAYDDRDKVVAMWRSHGVACFQVAPGDF
ncbi:MAG: hypothetical protein HRT34_03520 [Alcanivorax sp.]|nr:hypothetical protein [Alcanivorax sp.]